MKIISFLFFLLHSALCLSANFEFNDGRFGFTADTAGPSVRPEVLSADRVITPGNGFTPKALQDMTNSRNYLAGLQNMFNNSQARLRRALQASGSEPGYLRMLQADFNISFIHLNQAVASHESNVLRVLGEKPTLAPAELIERLPSRSLSAGLDQAKAAASQAYGRLNSYTYIHTAQLALDGLEENEALLRTNRLAALRLPESPARGEYLQTIDRQLSLVNEEKGLIRSRITDFLPTFNSGDSIVLGDFTDRYGANYEAIRSVRAQRASVIDSQIRLAATVSPESLGELANSRLSLEGDGLRFSNPILEQASSSLSRPLSQSERQAIILFSQTNDRSRLAEAFSEPALRRLSFTAPAGAYSLTPSPATAQSSFEQAVRSRAPQGTSDLLATIRSKLSLVMPPRGVDAFDSLYDRLSTPELKAGLVDFLKDWDGRSGSLMTYFDRNGAELGDFLRQNEIAIRGTLDGQTRYFGVDPHNPIGRQYLIERYTLPEDADMFQQMLERQREFVSSGDFVPYGGSDPALFRRVTGAPLETDGAVVDFYNLQNNPDDVGLLMREMQRDRLLVARMYGVTPNEADGIIRTGMLEAEGFLGVRNLASIEGTAEFMDNLQNRLMFYDRAFHGNDLEHGPNVHLDQSYRMGQARVIAATNPEFAARYPDLIKHTASDVWLAMANDNVSAEALGRQSNFTLPSGRDRALIQEVGDKVFEANPTSTLGDIRFRRVMGIDSYEPVVDILTTEERDTVLRRTGVNGRAWSAPANGCGFSAGLLQALAL